MAGEPDAPPFRTTLAALSLLLLAGCQPKPAPDTQRVDGQAELPANSARQAMAERPEPAPVTSATAKSVALDAGPALPEPAAAPKPADEKQAYRVVAVGDSITDERSFGGGYLRYVKERCPKTSIENLGKGGAMVNQIRRVFEERVQNRPIDTFTHLVVFGGVNDLYSDLTAGRTPDKVEKDLAIIYEKARAKGLRVVAITVSPWGGFKKYHNERRQKYTEELNGWIRAQQPAGSVDYVVDSYPLLSCGDPERLCPEYEQSSHDGLHPGKRGHEILGRALYEQVFDNCL